MARSGTARRAGTASPSWRAARSRIETRRGLPGDPDDSHSRYIEAAVDGVLVGCLYLPNGNPAPGPKFDYKLRWFERLTAHARRAACDRAPVVLAGDYNVMPTDLDVYKPERWLRRRAVPPGSPRRLSRASSRRAGPTRCATLHPGERIYTFWDYFRNAYGRDAGLRIDHLLLSPSIAGRLKSRPASIARSAAGRRPAITRRRGSSCPMGARASASVAPIRRPVRGLHPGSRLGRSRSVRRWINPVPPRQHAGGERTQSFGEGRVFDAGDGGVDHGGVCCRRRGRRRCRGRRQRPVDEAQLGNGAPAEKGVDALDDQWRLVLQLDGQRPSRRSG